MQASGHKAFRISFVLHAVFFTCLGLVALFHTIKKKPELHVFTLMPPPSPSLQEPQPTAENALTLEAPKLLEPVDNKPLPELPEPTPEPPAPEPIAKPTSAPAPKLKPKPEPAQKKMSYEQFVKEQGKPKPQKKKTKAPQPIDTQSITNELKVVLSSSKSTAAPLSNNDLAAIQAYNRRLHTKIDAVWKKPATSGDLNATVQFSLSSEGNIYDVTIVKSSGNALFDASILDAFRAVGNAGPPPNKQGGTYQVRFS